MGDILMISPFRIPGPSTSTPSTDDTAYGLDYLSGGSSAVGFFGAPTGSPSDSGSLFGIGSSLDFGGGTGSGGFSMDFGDIDAMFGSSSSTGSGDTAGTESDGGFGGFFDSLMASLDSMFGGSSGAGGTGGGSFASKFSGDFGSDFTGDYADDSVDISGDSESTSDGADSGFHPMNMTSSPFKGSGAPGDLQSFNRRPYGKNEESMFGTYFDPKNATAAANGGMNLHMAGKNGTEITSPTDATAYGSYTTTTKTQDVHGANQTAFFYGDQRRFEVDLFEPALHNGDVNSFTSGVWLDNKKVAEVSIKASDLGFKSFHDQPITYKMDFTEGNIKISALDAKGEWKDIVNHSDPRINNKLASDTHFKQMFSVWGVDGQYNGAPVDFQVQKTGYSAQVI